MEREIYNPDSKCDNRLMKLSETKLAGVYVIELPRHLDERGYYQRLWGENEFESLGLISELNNVGLSYNAKRGTVRGMHFQAAPFEEAKFVQCIRGSIYDVVLDIRPDSKSFGEWIHVELTRENCCALFIPKGLAHGFQTLEDDSEVLYCISEKYSAEHSRGIRWNDARFSIEFPLKISCINERDANFPDFV